MLVAHLRNGQTLMSLILTIGVDMRDMPWSHLWRARRQAQNFNQTSPSLTHTTSLENPD